MTTLHITPENKLVRGWLADRGAPVHRHGYIVTDATNPAALYELLCHAAKAVADTIAQGDAFDYWESPDQRDEAFARLAAIAAAAGLLSTVLDDVVADSPQEYLDAAAARYANV